MRDDDHDPAARPNAENGLGERLLAFGVEIGIGLVEHDQERLAVERARERNSLLLSSGQRRPALAELGLVAGGQVDDQVVHAGGLGRGDYGCRRADLARSERCSAQPFLRTARHPAADNRCGGRGPRRSTDRWSPRRAARSHGRPAIPRRLHAPATTCQRRSVRQYPEHCRLSELKLNVVHDRGSWRPGGATLNASSDSACVGGGKLEARGGERQWRRATRRAAASPAAPTQSLSSWQWRDRSAPARGRTGSSSR